MSPHQDYTPPVVYLAHPIDQATNLDRVWPAVVERVRDLARQCGVPVYSPGLAWSLDGNATPHQMLQLINDYALRTASHVVVVLPYGVASIGTPFELAQAIASDSRVILLYDYRLEESSWLLPFIKDRVHESVGYRYDADTANPLSPDAETRIKTALLNRQAGASSLDSLRELNYAGAPPGTVLVDANGCAWENFGSGWHQGQQHSIRVERSNQGWGRAYLPASYRPYASPEETSDDDF